MKRYKKIKSRAKRVLKQFVYRSIAPNSVILMYHRIGEIPADPWEIFVSEPNFRQHLQLLKDEYRVLPFADLDKVIKEKKSSKQNVFITFDDGCLDNFEIAFPLLEEFNFPATFFIPAANLSYPSIFWWEVLDFIFWAGQKLPGRIELNTGKEKFKRELNQQLQVGDQLLESRWSANREVAPSDRCQLYLDICDWIRPKCPEEQQIITEQLIGLLETDVNKSGFFKKMDARQIAMLAKHNFEIGGHTIHHPALRYHHFDLQQKEIGGCISKLENVTGNPIVSFAYPHGEYNADTITLMKENKIRQACTTDWGGVDFKTDRLVLPRVLVRNANASFLKEQLDYLFKPRKL